MTEKQPKPQTFNVALSPELANFVRERVDSGHYASASEVVREALRALAQPQQGPLAGAASDALAAQEAAIDRDRARAGIAALRRLRPGTTLGPDVTPRDLIDDGRA